MRPSYQQPLHPPLSHKHNPTLVPGSSPVCGGVSLWIPPSSSCQPLTARLGTVPTAVPQDRVSVVQPLKEKKKTTRKAAKYTQRCIAGLFCSNFVWQSSSSTSFALGAHVLAHAAPIHRQVSPAAKRSHLRDCEELGDFPSLS